MPDNSTQNKSKKFDSATTVDTKINNASTGMSTNSDHDEYTNQDKQDTYAEGTRNYTQDQDNELDSAYSDHHEESFSNSEDAISNNENFGPDSEHSPNNSSNHDYGARGRSASSKAINPDSFAPKIAVFGIGGAGCNATTSMLKDLHAFEEVQFIAANTDHQVLRSFPSNIAVQLGPNCTRGLGAGANPEIGRQAAIESEQEIRDVLEGIDMVFIASGMGGGTGTGAAPFVAGIARELGILTIAVVTIPFSFEGMKRNKIAQKGIAELKEKADCVVVVPNDKLLNIINTNTPLSDAFKMADDILYNAVKCVVELIMKPGLINLDFADIRTVMSNMRTAFLSIGRAVGEDRALKAAEIAINNPLSNVSLKGAASLLINISGGSNLTLHEINVAVAKILEERGENTHDANILVGATYNETMQDEISVYTIATGIHDDFDYKALSDSNKTSSSYADSKYVNNLDNFLFNQTNDDANNRDAAGAANDIKNPINGNATKSSENSTNFAPYSTNAHSSSSHTQQDTAQNPFKAPNSIDREPYDAHSNNNEHIDQHEANQTQEVNKTNSGYDNHNNAQYRQNIGKVEDKPSFLRFFGK